MTTLAWDGTTLAGDTQGTIGDCLRVTATKIFRLDDGRLYGGSGKYDEVLMVRDWLNAGGDKPQVKEFAAMLIGPDGSCARLEENLVPMPIVEGFHAVGSGRDFAMAAMAMGGNAEEAVAVAARFDIWTGGAIETLTREESPMAAKKAPAKKKSMPPWMQAPQGQMPMPKPAPAKKKGT